MYAIRRSLFNFRDGDVPMEQEELDDLTEKSEENFLVAQAPTILYQCLTKASATDRADGN